MKKKDKKRKSEEERKKRKSEEERENKIKNIYKYLLGLLYQLHNN